MDKTVFTLQYVPVCFVNRKEEAELVMVKLRNLMEGRPVEKRAITFTGERGTGKTWLLAHLKTLLSELTGVIVLCLNVKDYGGKDPSSAVAQIIRRVNRATDGSDEALGIELAEMSRKLVARLKEVLSIKVLILLLDHVHESEWKLLSVLEDYLLGPLITMPRVLIVMTGRGWLYPWKTPELRLKGEFVNLKPFCEEDTKTQVKRQVPEPCTTPEKVHHLSDGNPLANYLIAYYGISEGGLNEVIEGLLEPIPEERRQKVREYVEALCVLRAFDEERIPTMLAVYYDDDSYRDWTFAQARKVRQELICWALARWDSGQSGYVIDRTVRKLVEEYLKAARPDKWRALQQSASELYQEWAKEFPKTKERWQEEARYHISFLKRASFATM